MIHGSPEGTGPSPGTKASSLFLLPGHLWAPVTIARVTGAELRGSRHPLGRPTGKRRPSWSWRGRSRGRRSRRVDSGHARILPLPRRLTKEEPRPLPSGFQLGSAKRRHRRKAGGGRSERWGASPQLPPTGELKQNRILPRGPSGGPRNAPLSARPPGLGTGTAMPPAPRRLVGSARFGDKPSVSATPGEPPSKQWTHLLLREAVDDLGHLVLAAGGGHGQPTAPLAHPAGNQRDTAGTRPSAAGMPAGSTAHTGGRRFPRRGVWAAGRSRGSRATGTAPARGPGEDMGPRPWLGSARTLFSLQ